VLDAGSLGADSYEPAFAASALSAAPLVVFGRQRPSSGTMPVSIRFDEAAVSLRVAATVLERLREALEAPDLWLAR
jgi:hypothetical protein